MAQRIIGVSKRLLEVAKQEFLEKGFEGASLRTIAQKAQTSPRAIYTRFANKEELFAAVVEPVYSDFMKLFNEDKAEYWNRAKKRDFSAMPEEFYKKYLDFAYNHRDQFYLLLKCSAGTRFEHFTQQLSKTDLQNVKEKIPQIIDGIKPEDYDEATRLFLETITFAFYDSLFTPLVQGIPLDVAKSYITKLTRFYSDGIMSGLERFSHCNLQNGKKII